MITLGVLMRSADATTLFRVLLVVLAAFLVIIKFNVWLIIIIIAVAFVLDAVDGYFAVHESSNGKVGIVTYLSAALGNPKSLKIVKSYKSKVSKNAPSGPRMDVAGDRAAEYILWITFTYLHIIPLIITVLIVIRHSFVDAVMGARGTSSKMNTGIGKVLYSSNTSRFFINVVKFITFAYLCLVYISGYPIIIGYVLVGILFTYIMVRGIAEVYDSSRAS